MMSPRAKVTPLLLLPTIALMAGIAFYYWNNPDTGTRLFLTSPSLEKLWLEAEAETDPRKAITRWEKLLDIWPVTEADIAPAISREQAENQLFTEQLKAALKARDDTYLNKAERLIQSWPDLRKGWAYVFIAKTALRYTSADSWKWLEKAELASQKVSNSLQLSHLSHAILSLALTKQKGSLLFPWRGPVMVEKLTPRIMTGWHRSDALQKQAALLPPNYTSKRGILLHQLTALSTEINSRDEQLYGFYQDAKDSGFIFLAIQALLAMQDQNKAQLELFRLTKRWLDMSQYPIALLAAQHLLDGVYAVDIWGRIAVHYAETGMTRRAKHALQQARLGMDRITKPERMQKATARHTEYAAQAQSFLTKLPVTNTLAKHMHVEENQAPSEIAKAVIDTPFSTVPTELNATLPPLSPARVKILHVEHSPFLHREQKDSLLEAGQNFVVFVEAGTIDWQQLQVQINAIGKPQALLKNEAERYHLSAPIIVTPRAALVIDGTQETTIHIDVAESALIVNAGSVYLSNTSFASASQQLPALQLERGSQSVIYNSVFSTTPDRTHAAAIKITSDIDESKDTEITQKDVTTSLQMIGNQITGFAFGIEASGNIGLNLSENNFAHQSESAIKIEQNLVPSLLYANKVENSRKNGIEIQQSHCQTIFKNIIARHKQHGLAINEANTLYLLDNQIVSNRKTGIRLKDDAVSRLFMLGNKVSHNAIGLEAESIGLLAMKQNNFTFQAPRLFKGELLEANNFLRHIRSDEAILFQNNCSSSALGDSNCPFENSSPLFTPASYTRVNSADCADAGAEATGKP